MSALRLQIEQGSAAFEPGQRVRGRVAWKLDAPLEKLELRLVWRTTGEAIPDEQGVLRLDWGEAGPKGEHSFELDIPAWAVSMRGAFFSLDWFLQLRAPGTPHFVERPITVGPRRRPVERAPESSLEQPPTLPSVRIDEAEELAGEVQTMRTNRGQGGRFVALLGLLAFGWNVAWVCFAFGLGPFVEPAPLWIWVILLPVALVGVLVAMMFTSGLLVWLGPAPSVRMRSDELQAGSEVALAWTVSPGRRQPRPWRLTLEAREEVSTRLDGTKGRGEKVWYRGVIADYPGMDETVQDAVRLSLPGDLVPSFESRSLVIRWTLRFAASSPRRSWTELPWMDKEFEIEVVRPGMDPAAAD